MGVRGQPSGTQYYTLAEPLEAPPNCYQPFGDGPEESLCLPPAVTLQGIYTSQTHDSIEKFVTARRLTGHPIAVFRWNKD